MDDIRDEEPLEEDEPKAIIEEDEVEDTLSDEPIPLGQLKKKDLIDPDLVDEDEDEDEDEEEDLIENNGMWEE